MQFNFYLMKHNLFYQEFYSPPQHHPGHIQGAGGPSYHPTHHLAAGTQIVPQTISTYQTQYRR